MRCDYDRRGVELTNAVVVAVAVAADAIAVDDDGDAVVNRRVWCERVVLALECPVHVFVCLFV